MTIEQADANLVTSYIRLHGTRGTAARVLSQDLGQHYDRSRMGSWQAGARPVPWQAREAMVRATLPAVLTEEGLDAEAVWQRLRDPRWQTNQRIRG